MPKQILLYSFLFLRFFTPVRWEGLERDDDDVERDFDFSLVQISVLPNHICALSSPFFIVFSFSDQRLLGGELASHCILSTEDSLGVAPLLFASSSFWGNRLGSSIFTCLNFSTWPVLSKFFSSSWNRRKLCLLHAVSQSKVLVLIRSQVYLPPAPILVVWCSSIDFIDALEMIQVLKTTEFVCKSRFNTSICSFLSVDDSLFQYAS